MSVREQYWKYSLIGIVLVLGYILFREFIPYLGGILGAITIYILVRNQMFYLIEKNIGGGASLLSLFCWNLFWSF